MILCEPARSGEARLGCGADIQILAADKDATAAELGSNTAQFSH